MGYQIEYHLQEIRHIKPKRRLPFWGRLALIALTVTAGHFLLALLQTAAGGQWRETVAALEQMAEDLKTGASFREAAQVFCRELMP